MYQSQQRSTDLCSDFYIHSTQDSFCSGNCLRSKLWIFVRGGALKAYLAQPLDILIRTHVPAGRASLYLTAPYLFYYTLPVRQMSYSVPRLSRKDAGIYCTVGS
jgi:hypothetical protein